MRVVKNQIKELMENGYTIQQSSRELDLFRDDFHGKAWDEICQCLKIKEESEEVVIVYIGVKTEKENQ